MSMGEGDEGSLDAAYKYFSVNDRALGSVVPLQSGICGSSKLEMLRNPLVTPTFRSE